MRALKLRRCWCLRLIPPWRLLCWRHACTLDDEGQTPVAQVRR